MAEGPDDDVRLGERPEPDKLVRAVARSRVAEKLFATKEPVRLGRYHLLEVVGEGGMGVVWGAWDPELERRVAIKLLSVSRSSARERMLAEGQALAKLSHPNVVPVYDVGVVDERVYLVMEWVRGKNLRAWADAGPRSVREIVEVYRAAGAGLLAAHEAKIVHRDFKPDNAVVGDDGRVRVLDFGLARSEVGLEGAADATVTRGAGTPRYMAPEQKEGRELTGAVDQFAFGVSLREAVARHGDVPAWIAAICTRATRSAPTERFPSMADVLAALARDPRVVWRRRIAVGAIVAVAGGAFAAGTLRSSHAVERCGGGRAEIATTWSAAQRDPLVTKLRALGAYGEVVAAQIGAELDAYTERWAIAQRGACLAADAGELPPARYEQNLGCLARARAGLAAAHDVLVRADLARLPDAVVAARSLPEPSHCRIEAEASTVAPPSAALAPRVAELANDVARARVLALAVDPASVEFAATTEQAAAALGYGPLAGQAALAHGTALMWNRQRGQAAGVFDRAQALAFGAGDLAIGVEAYARELFAVATTSAELSVDADQVIAGAAVVESLARGLGPTGAFARSLLLNNLGTVQLSRNDRAGARRWFEAALRERPPMSGEVYELASIPGNLALVEDDPQRRSTLLAQERDELAAVVGDDHPLMLDTRAKASAFAVDPAVARSELRAAYLQVQRLHPQLAGKFGSLPYDLMWLAWDAGDESAMREARAWIENDFDNVNARALLLLEDGKVTEAAELARTHVETLLALGTVWPRWRALDALLVLGRCQQQAGQRDDARATVARATKTATELDSFANTIFFKRRMARLDALRVAVQ